MQATDLLILGGGSAGLAAARTAARMGARVVLAERAVLGGAHLHTGCVPTKALLSAAKAARAVQTAARFGLRVQGRVEVDPYGVWQHVRQAIERAGAAQAPERLEAAGIRVVRGQARFLTSRAVAVGDLEFRAGAVLIATGGQPWVPDLPGLADSGYWTHVHAVEAMEIPESLCVVGGGPVGVELAQAFSRLGAQVTVVHAGRRLLPREEPEISEALRQTLEAEGLEIHAATRIVEAGPGWVGDGQRRFDAARVLMATGRSAAIDDLDLGLGGITTDAGGVVVDAGLRTAAPGVFAAGDVHGHLRFTHLARYEGETAATAAVRGRRGRPIDPQRLPWVTFTDTEIAHLGLTEPEARQRHGDRVRVSRYALADLDRAICEGRPEGFCKLVLDARGQFLGAHAIGPGAGDWIAQVAVAMAAGADASTLARMLQAYPTYAEAVGSAALDAWAEHVADGRLGDLNRAWLSVRRARA